MNKKRKILMLFCVIMVFAGGMINSMKVFGGMGNPYSDTDEVRVDIVFEKEAVDSSSIDTLIEKISKEVLDGEKLETYGPIGEYELSANVLYGQLNAIRRVEGVKSVKVASLVYPIGESTETLENTEQKDTESQSSQSTQDETDMKQNENKNEKSAARRWWIPVGAAGVVGAGVVFSQIKKRKFTKKR